MLQVTDMPALRRNSEILDTADLSQVNFVYNNITFQVYPNPKITNERSRGAYNGKDIILIANYTTTHTR